MESLVDFALQERYKQVKDLGDRLGELSTLIEWEPFREIVGEIYTNTTDQGGQPNIDVVLMIKLLVLQSMYGLSDPELERQANDKISFLRFLCTQNIGTICRCHFSSTEKNLHIRVLLGIAEVRVCFIPSQKEL